MHGTHEYEHLHQRSKGVVPSKGRSLARTLRVRGAGFKTVGLFENKKKKRRK
jgi:hypothetical protein